MIIKIQNQNQNSGIISNLRATAELYELTETDLVESDQFFWLERNIPN